jgi:hypothetical protein
LYFGVGTVGSNSVDSVIVCLRQRSVPAILNDAVYGRHVRANKLVHPPVPDGAVRRGARGWESGRSLLLTLRAAVRQLALGAANTPALATPAKRALEWADQLGLRQGPGTPASRCVAVLVLGRGRFKVAAANRAVGLEVVLQRGADEVPAREELAEQVKVGRRVYRNSSGEYAAEQ